MKGTRNRLYVRLSLDAFGTPRDKLAEEIDTLCSLFESRVETPEFATVSLNAERAMPLPQLVSSDARMRDVKTPSEGVA